jgi:hypothetical protein
VLLARYIGWSGYALASSSFSRFAFEPRVLTARKVLEEFAVISLLIGILIVIVVGAICFWAIDKFVRDRRLANLLKLLVVLICLASILQRVLPLAGIGWL